MEKTTDKLIEMFEAPKSRFNSHYNRIEPEIPKTDTRTMTVPSSQLSLRDIKKQYASGMPITGIGQGEMFFDDGKGDSRNLAKMDWNDIQSLQEETYLKVEFLRDKWRNEQAAKVKNAEEQAKIKREAFEDEIKAYVTKYGSLKGGDSQH